jgi:hypothetical protein
MTSSNPNYYIKLPYPNTIQLGDRVSTYQFGEQADNTNM